MQSTEATLLIGGAAGDGIASTGESYAKYCARLGLHVFAYNSYQSVIRGGHVYLQVRVGVEKILSHGDHPDVLIALNQDTMDRHANVIGPGGALVFNRDKIQINDAHVGPGVTPCPMPVGDLTAAFGKKPIMQNTIALGASIWLLQMPMDILEDVFKHTWSDKPPAVAQTNFAVAMAGYNYAKEHFKPLGRTFTFSKKARMLIAGNQAFGVAAVAAGCKFYAAYPMTPASSLLHWLAPNGPKYGMVVKQAEDEIAVLNMAIGAGFAGVRSMVGTSGGGFALMTEAVGLAAMTETPVVIMTSQRGGPSTGLPTKTEQGDLHQVMGASQGDYPRVILAPTNMEDAFHAVVESFNLSEKYQTPVIVMSDLYLSEHLETIENLPTTVPIDRGALATPHANGGSPYHRYADSPSGASPRAFPGQEGLIHIASSDEHTNDGTLISDLYTNPVLRKAMMEKRMKKLDGILKDTAAPAIKGPADAPLTLVGWGSTEQVIQEAIGRLAHEGITVNHIQFRHIFPFHAEAATTLLKNKKFMVIECNYSGQFARHLRAETGIEATHILTKYDGEPFEPRQIVEEVRKVVKGGVKERMLTVCSREGV